MKNGEFKSWQECVRVGFENDEAAAIEWLNSAFSNKLYRKTYNMKKQAIVEIAKKDPRFAAALKEAEAKVAGVIAGQLKK